MGFLIRTCLSGSQVSGKSNSPPFLLDRQTISGYSKIKFNLRREAMKAKVTNRGLVIPREMLSGVEEVEIRKEDRCIVISLLSKSDPILTLGKNPVECGAPNASEHHDSYIYGSGS